MPRGPSKRYGLGLQLFKPKEMKMPNIYTRKANLLHLCSMSSQYVKYRSSPPKRQLVNESKLCLKNMFSSLMTGWSRTD